MSDRDTFAAAALTGLLISCPFNTDAVPRLAYSMADAMLSERERVAEPLPKEKPAKVLLTAEEREAVEAAIAWIETPSIEDGVMPEDYEPMTATLRAMLQRLA